MCVYWCNVVGLYRPSKELTRCKVCTPKDQHNWFGCVLSEHENSVCISSHIYLKGWLWISFDHYFTARLIYTLVCVHWYDSATTDQSSELKHMTKMPHCQIRFISEIFINLLYICQGRKCSKQILDSQLASVKLLACRYGGHWEVHVYLPFRVELCYMCTLRASEMEVESCA